MAFRLFANFLSKHQNFLKNYDSYLKGQYIQFGTQSSFRPTSRFGKLGVAVGVLGIAGGTYGYFTAKRGKKSLYIGSESVEVKDYYETQAPDIKPSRQVSGPAKALGLKLMLYQYQTCPFCCKVRVFLDYYGVPYDVVEVNPVKRQQIKFSKYKKVPILVAYDEKNDVKHQLNDSSTIISILGTYLLDSTNKLQDILSYYIPVKYSDEDGKEMIEVMNQYFLMYGENALNEKSEEIRKERHWRRWVDQEFVHVLSPNIYRSTKESLEAFRHFSDVGEWDKHFSKFERTIAIYLGATAMYFVGRRLKKKYALKEDVRQSLYDHSRLWMKNVGKSKFMGGDYPNLADLSVYGVLKSIEGCEAFNDLLSNTNIGSWYKNMKTAVDNHYGYELITYKTFGTQT